MARCLSKPYRPTNPRTVRGAQKRGWHVVQAQNGYEAKASWMGLNIWCEQQMSSYWVSSFQRREFAFESGADATAFKLRWG
jgi:hypothetical protein